MCISNKEVTRTDDLVSFLEYHSPNAFLQSTDFDIHVDRLFYRLFYSNCNLSLSLQVCGRGK